MKKQFWMILLVLAAIFALATACGDDGDEGETGDGTVHFRGYVVDFSTKAPLSGVTIYVLDNTTGDKLALDPQVSNATGYVEYDIPLPDGVEAADFKVGFLCEGVVDESVDTYQFNLPGNAEDEKLWLVDATTYMIAPAAAGVTLEAGKTVVAGGVYWVNAEDKEEIVGCSLVDTDTGSGEVRYFSDNTLPASMEIRDSINPLNGFFIIANIDPGVVNVQGYMDGEDYFGASRLVAKPDSICISNIYAETDANPGTCQ